MPEHFPKNTLECTAYCKKCGGMSQHRVDGGRRGPCLPCIVRQERDNQIKRIREGLKKEQSEEREKQNPKLF